MTCFRSNGDTKATKWLQLRTATSVSLVTRSPVRIAGSEESFREVVWGLPV